MTPSEVLTVFRAQHAFARELDLALPDIELTTKTTVRAWRDAMDLLAGWTLGAALNEYFNIVCTPGEWEAVLEPARERRLADVCALIASRAEVPVIEAAEVLGVRCAKAGAFLAVREMLRRAGANVSELRPSSLLTQYSRDYWPRLYNDLTRTSPALVGRMVLVSRSDAAHFLAGLLLFAGALIFGALIAVKPLVGVAGTLGSLILFVWVWRNSEKRQRVPRCVDFKGMATFRDLCALIADGWRPLRGLLCPACRYSLTGLTNHRCPECGRAFSAAEFGVSDEELSRLLDPTAAGGLM